MTDDRFNRISAYLDGALSEDEAARLEAEAAADPALAAEIEAAGALDAEIGAAFDALLDAPLPAALTAAVSATTTPGTRLEEARPTVAAAAPVGEGRAAAPEVPEAEPGAPGQAALGGEAASVGGIPPGGNAPREEMPPPDYAAANENRRPFFSSSIAAALALLLVGAGAGALMTRALAPGTELADGHATRGWMDEIADYHRVYARQVAHLVEVPAREKDHIETWLGKETGVPFRVPDLAASGFEFRGARLLVAGGRPVAQLLYTDGEGRVMALCVLAREGEGSDEFTPRSFDGVEMVRWLAPGAAWVAVGEPGMDLEAVAREAAQEV
ncbi:zf-HC2 domain-containing protein [Vannielia litorea]|uniref:Transmembrane transcriptional regulator (Anti-sigma factor RsiW) n=1 Tax=Vannielia litorea TaxID=1217970 RepID=A0A1N6III5_9RHOB|nr:zf-HC2 domain-containing protein [Vannielia litorea]SIO31793.1 Transmembrane transcriptional regulator (anti-sigma factor RsiW) [Vannielia litorea]